MNNVNKTLYIPLYGKAFVSSKAIILDDKKAEFIWSKEGFELKGKSKSKWLAYNMGMRSAVFDSLVKNAMETDESAVVLHIGCGMDSRIERVGANGHRWYDIDFPDVIEERKKYYEQTELYSMLCSDARENRWIDDIPERGSAIIIMEGVSMYFKPDELKTLLYSMNSHFHSVHIFMDTYSVWAANASKHKNPINDVGVTTVYGIDSPHELEQGTGLQFVTTHELTPDSLCSHLKGGEKIFFKLMFRGGLASRIYRLYEFKSN